MVKPISYKASVECTPANQLNEKLIATDEKNQKIRS